MKSQKLFYIFMIFCVGNSILFNDLASFFNATYDLDHDGYATMP